LVIDLHDLDSLKIHASARRAEVGAGALWSDIVRATFELGLTPPVLTDYLGLTVGGTLSVGGIGGQSFARGAQVDNVAALSVVDGRGEVVRASASENRELFDAARGGLGRCGIIVSAELDLVPAPEKARIRDVVYTDLEPFLADQSVLCDRGELGYVLGNIPPRGAGWSYAIEAVEYLEPATAPRASFEGLAAKDISSPREVPYLEHTLRLEAMASAMRRSGSWDLAHPWIDVFVGRRHAAPLIARTLAEITPADVGDGYVMTYPVTTARFGAPLLRMPPETHAYLFDVLGSVPDAAVPTWVERAGRVSRAALEVAGSVYPIGSAPMSRGDWERQLGDRLATLRATGAFHDPMGIFPKHDGEAT